MKIVLATYGSRGDVQPMLALALALKHRGHAVILAAPPEKAAWVRQMNCAFQPLGSNLTAFIDRLHKVYAVNTMLRSNYFLRKQIQTQFHTLGSITANADLAIGSSLVAALPSIAEARKIPYRYIAFTPQVLPSSHHPCPLFRSQNRPRWYNRLTWALVRRIDRINNVFLINHHRRQLNLPAIADGWRHILGRHVIVACDAAIAQVPSDVHLPAHTQTAYLHLQQPEQSHNRLAQFLAKGTPPVYAGFGSMPRRDQMDGMATIIRAARMHRQRVVIAKFWDGATPYDRCEDIFFIDKYPHRDLFPHMAAIIHHGGAGTTATAARCGIRQIIVPHLLDQYYWGARILQANLGPAPIPRAKLTVSKLAQAIGTTLSDPSIAAAAKNTAAAISAKDSAQLNVDAIFNSLNDPGAAVA